jgi:S-adenosylmethionine:tRNA ribosyltransferase-isomerase
MKIDAFHYELPTELIAQKPAAARELARLLWLPVGEGPAEHRCVAELPELLPHGALVVVNDTRVMPARLLARKRDTGGCVEVLLVKRLGVRHLEGTGQDARPVEIWKALGKGNRSLKFGTDVEVLPRVTQNGATELGPHPRLLVRLLGRTEDGLLEIAVWTPWGEPISMALAACGRMPLPPYIKREADPADAERYQTVYARHDGAVAAPTAGLHLTHAMLDRLTVRGCEMASVTLHVGPGTFQPVRTRDLDEHSMHAESYLVRPSVADAVAKARGRGAPVIAIGTTTVRALESAADPERPGCVRATGGETRLLVQPGYRWRVVDGLLTNFHLPRSTLLALVCALGGTERVLKAYGLAIREGYRFFSYGDAMFLWREE